MKRLAYLRGALAGGVCALALATAAHAQAPRPFDLPAGDLSVTLEAYIRQSGAQLIYQPGDVRGRRSARVSGSLTPEEALDRLLEGTGLRVARDPTGAMMIVRPQSGTAGEGATGDATQVGDIVVTGSRIRGANPTAPVHIVSREDIDRSGYGNVSDLVRSLPENFGGGLNRGVLAAPSPNQNISNGSMMNLRGVGADATLSLLNGRRMAADTLGQSADVSVIPLAAIARIEIVTDGSSAIYGSDAVVGVANFLLRKDFDGADISARVGTATQGGGFEQGYSALVGKSSDAWRALLSLGYSRQDAILASERDFTAGSPPRLTLSRPFEQTSAFFSGGAQLSDRISFDLDALWSDRSVRFLQQSRLASSAIQSTSKTPSYSVGGGITIELPAGWQVRADGTTSHSRTDQRNVSATSDTTVRYDNEVRSAELTASGDLFQLPAGGLKAAIGGGWREEERGGSGISASHHSTYAFGEVLVPVVRDVVGLNELDLSLSARYENYSDFGHTTTPKIGIRYVPLNGLTLRGTWGKSFKAPSFQQAAAAPIITITRATTAGGTGPGVVFFALGGNPDLKPERSTSLTVGADYVPPRLRSMTLGLTYFDIDYTDRVVSPISPTSIALSDPTFAPWVIRNPSPALQQDWLSSAVTVHNLSGAPYDPSTVVAIINNRPANATSQTVRGFDLSYRQRFTFADTEIHGFANATWLEVRQRTLSSLPEFERTGAIYNPPRFRARAGLTVERGRWAVTAIANRQSNSTDAGVVPSAHIASQTLVDANIAYRFGDVGGIWNRVGLDLSITNLFDLDPPYAASPAISYLDGIHYDATNASPVGRFVAITVRKQF